MDAHNKGLIVRLGPAPPFECVGLSSFHLDFPYRRPFWSGSEGCVNDLVRISSTVGLLRIVNSSFPWDSRDILLDRGKDERVIGGYLVVGERFHVDVKLLPDLLRSGQIVVQGGSLDGKAETGAHGRAVGKLEVPDFKGHGYILIPAVFGRQGEGSLVCSRNGILRHFDCDPERVVPTGTEIFGRAVGREWIRPQTLFPVTVGRMLDQDIFHFPDCEGRRWDGPLPGLQVA